MMKSTKNNNKQKQPYLRLAIIMVPINCGVGYVKNLENVENFENLENAKNLENVENVENSENV